MIEGVNFIGSEKSAQNDHYIRASDPKNNGSHPEKFFVATQEEVDRAVQKARSAFEEYKLVSGEQKTLFLENIALEIGETGQQLVSRVMTETGYPEPRVQTELGRTINQINMFAGLLRDGSWLDARIDRARPNRTPVPKPDIRQMRFPVGPVAVFGASNFPLAFSTAGGDTVSALAAGCPVVVKAHESHPGTNELVSRAILKAAAKTGMPEGVFSTLIGEADTGAALVKHPGIKAVGFTGSRRAGKAIFDLAVRREEPIPVYAEMGSVNPVFLIGQTEASSSEEIAALYAGSVTLTHGQFCTKPGIIAGYKGKALDNFIRHLKQKLQYVAPACMLNQGIATSYRENLDNLFSQNGVEGLVKPDRENGTTTDAAMALVEASVFLKNRNLHDEIFGPFVLVVSCTNRDEMEQVARDLDGQLTVTVTGTSEEIVDNKSLISILREKAGRVIFNGVPTGVEVCPSMMHGGPFPATTDSKFTSVGTGAIYRFVRPVAFQDCPGELLPDELKDGNPLGITRAENP